MNMVTVLLRIIHVTMGVFWAGTIFFVVSYLFGAVADAGPGGGQVMMALLKRRFFNTIPIVAVLTVLSGLWLLDRTSGHFGSDFMGSPMGITLSIGATAGLIALLVGIFVGRPATLGSFAARAKAASLPDGAEKAAAAAEADALRAKGQSALRAVAALLLVAVLAMAVARYM